MMDEIRSNLEPIDESDMNLKDKFVGGVGVENEKNEEGKIESIHSIEGAVERKEGLVEKEAAYSKILSKAPAKTQTVTTDEDVKNDAASTDAQTDAESKIQNLVKLAEVKGIAHAVKVARHLEDNYMLDEFHDRLLGEELHGALVQKGIIKEI